MCRRLTSWPIVVALTVALFTTAAAQEDDIEWEEEDAATPLLEMLRALDPPLPCVVAEAEVVPTFEANTIRVSMATEGCDDSVTRDPGPEAPAIVGVYVRLADTIERFVAEQKIENVTAFKMQFAALGWTAVVDRGAWTDASGSADERIRDAATWTSTAAGVTVPVPPALEGAGDEDDRKVLSAESIAGVIRANLSSLQYCQQSRIDYGAGTRPVGEARIRMTIDARGVVRDPEVVSSTFDDADVDACLLERFTQMVFPESSTGEEFDITWPVKLD